MRQTTFFFQETNKSYNQFSINEYINERKNQQDKQTNNQQNINKTGNTHWPARWTSRWEARWGFWLCCEEFVKRQLTGHKYKLITNKKTCWLMMHLINTAFEKQVFHKFYFFLNPSEWD